jgi:hypothetical protein
MYHTATRPGRHAVGGPVERPVRPHCMSELRQGLLSRGEVAGDALFMQGLLLCSQPSLLFARQCPAGVAAIDFLKFVGYSGDASIKSCAAILSQGGLTLSFTGLRSSTRRKEGYVEVLCPSFAGSLVARRRPVASEVSLDPGLLRLQLNGASLCGLRLGSMCGPCNQQGQKHRMGDLHTSGGPCAA